MSSTPVYIICSPRPLVGKTLTARLLSEFLLLKNGQVTSFDINLKEPSLLDFLPDLTETADIADTYGKMALMDRVILDDGMAKVIDLGFHAFDEFFTMSEEIGFQKEAVRRNVVPIILFRADTDRVSMRGHDALRRQIPAPQLITVDNEYVVRGDYVASEKDTISARWLASHNSLTPDLFANTNALPGVDTLQSGPSRSIGIFWTHVVSNRTVNELRFTAQSINFGFDPTAATSLSSLPHSSIGRLEVIMVERFSYRRMMISRRISPLFCGRILSPMSSMMSKSGLRYFFKSRPSLAWVSWESNSRTRSKIDR